MVVKSNKFEINSLPVFSCPNCENGVLRIVKDSMKKYHPGWIERLADYPNEEDFFDNENDPSPKRRRMTKWDIVGDLHEEFVCNFFLECISENCREKVGTTGKLVTEEVIEYHEDVEGYHGIIVDMYYPIGFEPKVDLFKIPKNTPESVKVEIEHSFKLFWISPSSCANAIRISLERLMDELKVRKKRRTRSGKYEELSLGNRLQDYKRNNPAIGMHLDAIKWIGNSGSHNNSLDVSDVVNAYQLIELSLKEIFENYTSNWNKYSKKIVKHKKPMSKISKRRNRK